MSNSATSGLCGSEDGVERAALGLGEQVTELAGAHPDLGAEVISEYDALRGGSGVINKQLRAPAPALTAECGER
jgi:hypothetical protein